MPFVDINGCKTFYSQKGSGPDIVLLHGFTSNSSIWLFANVIEPLAKSHRVTTYDLRGHGASSVTATGYDSQTAQSDLLALMNALQIERAILVGHSFGGVIATHFAVLHPERVVGIVFSDSYFPGLRELEPDMGQANVWQELRAQFETVGHDVGTQVDFDRLFQVVASMHDESWKSLEQSIGIVGVNWLRKLSPLATTRAGAEMFQIAGLTMERIAQLQCPVVALYDEFSPFQETRRYIERNLPIVLSEVIPKAKHLAPLQNSDGFRDAVQRGIDQIRAASVQANMK
jgi:3-oxoadipate enol-lactonase